MPEREYPGIYIYLINTPSKEELKSYKSLTGDIVLPPSEDEMAMLFSDLSQSGNKQQFYQ